VPGENRVEAMGLWGDAMHHDATTLHYTDTAAFFAGGPDAPPEIALNVGADHRFTDPSGLVYVAEADWPGAAPDGPARRTHHRVGATESDARFQSVREMPAAWALPALPAGTYDLTLGAARLGETPAVVDVAVVGPARLEPPLGALRLDLSERWEAVEGRVRFTLPERGAPVLRFSSDGAPPVLSTLVLRRL
jgi:hypothetical protein